MGTFDMDDISGKAVDKIIDDQHSDALGLAKEKRVGNSRCLFMRIS